MNTNKAFQADLYGFLGAGVSRGILRNEANCAGSGVVRGIVRNEANSAGETRRLGHGCRGGIIRETSMRASTERNRLLRNCRQAVIIQDRKNGTRSNFADPEPRSSSPVWPRAKRALCS